VNIDTGSGGHWEYAYDPGNRPVQVSHNGALVARYTCNGPGLRVRKSGASGTLTGGTRTTWKSLLVTVSFD
jgi:YD repeat-containing protein